MTFAGADNAEADIGGPPDRATTLRALGLALLGAVVVALVGEVARVYVALARIEASLLYRGPSYMSLSIILRAVFVILGCALVGVRARRDGDRDARVGSIALGSAAILATLAGLVTNVRESSPASGGLPMTALWIVEEPNAFAVALIAGVLLSCVVVAARSLGLPWHALLRPPRPAAPSVVVIALAALLLCPALKAMQSLGLSSLRDAVQGHAFGVLFGSDAIRIGLSISLLLPALELLVHGVARRAFAGATTTSFTVASAVAAALILPIPTPAMTVYAACLITGLAARRTESVVPGIVFWQALAVGDALWKQILS
jgi:hypothetical protein